MVPTSEKSERKNGFWVLFRGDHASHRSWLTGDNNSVKTFGSIPSQRHKCFFPFLHFFFLNSGTNTVDRGHVGRASWDPYTIGHLWRRGSCEGSNAVRFFALRYGGLQGGLVKIKLRQTALLTVESLADKCDHANESFWAAVVLFIMLYKVVVNFESVGEILKCNH